MSIFQSDKEDICIVVRYFMDSENNVCVIDEEAPPEGAEVNEVEFKFRYPLWGDTRAVMSAASSIGEDGISIDPYNFVDARIKRLISDWSLKNEKGNKVAINEQNIEKLPSDVVNYINRQLDQNPIIAKAFGNQA
jgi:hypothetical protein